MKAFMGKLIYFVLLIIIVVVSVFAIGFQTIMNYVTENPAPSIIIAVIIVFILSRLKSKK